jgi:hypothetical protein
MDYTRHLGNAPAKAREMAQRAGLLVLAALMLLAVSHDVRIFYNDVLQRLFP